MGQRGLGIGGERNVSLDAESAASSGGGSRAAVVEEAERYDVAFRLRGGRLEPAFERDRTEGRVLPDAAILRVPRIRSVDALQREKEPSSWARR